VHLGKVIGTVVCSTKVAGLEGVRLLLVQPVDHQKNPVGPPLVAVDRASASPGSLVMWESHREASLACEPSLVPVDSAIVGLVDEVSP